MRGLDGGDELSDVTMSPPLICGIEWHGGVRRRVLVVGGEMGPRLLWYGGQTVVFPLKKKRDIIFFLAGPKWYFPPGKICLEVFWGGIIEDQEIVSDPGGSPHPLVKAQDGVCCRVAV